MGVLGWLVLRLLQYCPADDGNGASLRLTGRMGSCNSISSAEASIAARTMAGSPLDMYSLDSGALELLTELHGTLCGCCFVKIKMVGMTFVCRTAAWYQQHPRAATHLPHARKPAGPAAAVARAAEGGW